MAIEYAFLFENNAKYVDLSFTMDLDFRNCFGSENPHLITEEIRYPLNYIKEVKLVAVAFFIPEYYLSCIKFHYNAFLLFSHSKTF